MPDAEAKEGGDGSKKERDDGGKSGREGRCQPVKAPLLGRLRRVRGCSSDGRALQSHCRGQEFDPPQLHHARRFQINILAIFRSWPWRAGAMFGIALVSQATTAVAASPRAILKRLEIADSGLADFEIPNR